MERLIGEEILPKLDFSDLDQCVDCIKGKFAKQIKKDGAKHSSGLLELIHTNICGPFNVRSVDGTSLSLIQARMFLYNRFLLSM